jgi:hypothetical protein
MLKERPSKSGGKSGILAARLIAMDLSNSQCLQLSTASKLPLQENCRQVPDRVLTSEWTGVAAGLSLSSGSETERVSACAKTGASGSLLRKDEACDSIHDLPIETVKAVATVGLAGIAVVTTTLQPNGGDAAAAPFFETRNSIGRRCPTAI